MSTAQIDVNPRVAIGNNSIHAELDELREKIRAERKLLSMTPAWRARWEMLLSDLTPTDKLVGLVISFFADDDGTGARPTMAVVEALTGLKKRRVTQGAAECVRAGMLVKQGGGYRGRAVTYDLAIPQKTLTELAERLRNPAPILPALPKRVHEGATISAESVHVDAPKEPERVHGGATHLTKGFIREEFAPEDDEDDDADIVHVNGTSIKGPGFELTYKTVEMTSLLAGITYDRGKMIAEIAARDWAARGFVPESPGAMLKSAMRHDAINGQIDNLKMKLLSAQLPAQIAKATSPPAAHWRDEEREKTRKTADNMAKVRAQFAEKKDG